MKFRFTAILAVLLLAASSLVYSQSAIIRSQNPSNIYESAKSSGGALHTVEPVITSAVWLASAARTATVTQADQTLNSRHRGIDVICNVTVVPTVETLILSIQKKDVQGNYVTLAANSAQAAAGVIRVKTHPNFVLVAAAVTGHTTNDILGDTYRLVMTHSASGSFTYGCTYQLII